MFSNMRRFYVYLLSVVFQKHVLMRSLVEIVGASMDEIKIEKEFAQYDWNNLVFPVNGSVGGVKQKEIQNT